jgi:hypothetical protein
LGSFSVNLPYGLGDACARAWFAILFVAIAVSGKLSTPVCVLFAEGIAE